MAKNDKSKAQVKRIAHKRHPHGERQSLLLQAPGTSRKLVLVLGLLLALGTWAAYAQVCGYGFILYDDNSYVYENSVVKAGLTWSGLAWAFKTFDNSNWHPVTWLSYMLDCEMFGPNAAPMHAVNLALHVANTLLLFAAFIILTGHAWRSAIVAGIFALHPLHVESVAWIAERKDVLSTFFALIAILLYVRYTRKPSVLRYAPMAVAFALGLMAKPMLVTLPLVLLLLDYWPLGRTSWPPRTRRLGTLLAEKVPLLALVAAESVLTFFAQRKGGAVEKLSNIPAFDRIANAFVGYMTYIVRAFLPANLGVLYPLKVPSSQATMGSILIVFSLTAVAISYVKRRPYGLVGWLWYAGMLVPVIGFVQVGAQSSADRYTYLPLVGLSVAAVWLVADLVPPSPVARGAATLAVCAMFVALGYGTYHQSKYWESSVTLFNHTLDVTDRNSIIHNNLGAALLADKKNAEAETQFRKALEIRPDYPDAQANLGLLLLRTGRVKEAIDHLNNALAAQPTNASALAGMGTLLVMQGRLEDARNNLSKSLEVSPNQPETLTNLGFVLVRMGHYDEAAARCRQAVQLEPDNPNAHYNLGAALAALGKRDEAAGELSKALSLKPDMADARRLLSAMGR